MIPIQKIYNEGITHNGTFHADDVLSTCLLMLLNPGFSYKRLSEIPENYAGIVYDIGGGTYDHHGEIKKRENGKVYAAFGLLWKEYGTYFMDRNNADLFDDVFITEIDRCDTSSNTNLLSSSIEFFNPNWNSIKDQDKAFLSAVNVFLPVLEELIKHFKTSTFIPRFCKTMNIDILIALENINRKEYHNKNLIHYDNATEAWNLYYKDIFMDENNLLFTNTFIAQVNKTYGKYKTSPFVLSLSLLPRRIRIEILERIIVERIDSINALLPARKECERIYNESVRKDVLIFNKYIPNVSISANHEDVKGIIFPSDRNGYNILLIEMNEKEKLRAELDPKISHRRMYFPEELRGRTKEELAAYSQGLIFIHPSGFIATCDRLENAVDFFNRIA